ncbi:MAG TPA: chloride channel protein [Thermoanaerobaculia bacterium]|jgi:CIC family chloride channel protein|nr:chloride channel protein [Thermoanaerobaculia bacterium]
MSAPEPVAPARPSRYGRLFWRDPNTQFLLLAAAAGICGGLGAIAFRFVTHYLTRLFVGSEDVVRGVEGLEPWLRVLIPTAGGLAGGLVATYFFGEKGPSGISHMIEVVSIGRRTVRVRPSLARAASSVLVISSGGSEGREGPIIQIGAGFASALARWWRVSPERVRILTACGMAAGVAGAYNTPIAATLFVLEVVVGSFSMAIFGPAVVSAVVSTLLVRRVLGDEPVYQVAPFQVESAIEYLPFVVIGLLGGLFSALFVRSLSMGKRLFSLTKLPQWATMAIGGAIVGTIAIFMPQVCGNGFEATDRILHGNPTLVLLLILLLAKTVATSATIGSGGVGGVFTPSLMVGAALGGASAKIVALAFPHLSAPVGGYALLGMGGMMAGVTRAPLLAVIMIFELTQNTAVLLPMMVVSVLAVVSARMLQKESMYVASLRSAGIVWEKTPEATALATLRVGDIMRRDVALIPASTPLPEIVAAFLRSRSLLLYVGDDQGRLLGAVDIHDVKESFPEKELAGLVVAADILTEIPFVTPEESLTTVNEKLWFRDVGQLPVVDSAASRKFLGIVTQRDLLGAFDSEVLKRNRLFTPVRTFGARESGGLEFLELPERHRLIELDVPAALEGLTVAEAAPRARFGISVLAVNRMGRDGVERRFVPGPADRFEHGDVLVVLGTEEAIAKLQDARGAPVTAG